MQIPEDWGVHCRSEEPGVPAARPKRAAPAGGGENAKRRRTTRDKTVDGQGGVLLSPTEENVYDAVTQAISCTKAVTGASTELVLDGILSRVPYRAMLEELFGGTDRLPPSVPIVTRVYEESFMRECLHAGERACVMGARCEGMFVDRQHPFTVTEFLLPGEPAPESAQMCVLCSRKVTQQLYHDMLFAGTTFRGVIQRYGNICGEPGEYAREAVLVCPPHGHVHCMPLPIVAHQRNRYSVSVHAGKKYLRQHR
eukprot:3087223-Rhodomonas_salina.1